VLMVHCTGKQILVRILGTSINSNFVVMPLLLIKPSFSGDKEIAPYKQDMTFKLLPSYSVDGHAFLPLQRYKKGSIMRMR